MRETVVKQFQDPLTLWENANNIRDKAKRDEFQNGKEVHVWYAPLNNSIEVFNELSAKEKLKASKFRSSRDQQRYIRSHGILRRILAAYVNCEPCEISFQTTEYGKPFLTNGGREVHFNMSHSNEIAAYAVSKNHELGIDIEHIDHDLDWFSIAKFAFSQEENDLLESLSNDQQIKAFYSLWTRKEALLKARGTGLSEIETMSGKEFNSVKRKYLLSTFSCGGSYQGALAVNNHNQMINYYQVPCLNYVFY